MFAAVGIVHPANRAVLFILVGDLMRRLSASKTRLVTRANGSVIVVVVQVRGKCYV
jgi:hypothetical protein